MLEYYFKEGTKEFISSGECAKSPREDNKDVLSANGTFVEPPTVPENKATVFNDVTEEWGLVDDFRGTIYYEEDGTKKEITELNVVVPTENTLTEPPTELHKPHWTGAVWEEGTLLYLDVPIVSKAEVDSITTGKIKELGEDKVKTLKLKAIDTSTSCPEWDAFVVDRDILVTEGDTFITDNNLT